MNTLTFSSSRDAILYYAGKHSDGLVTREEVDQEDEPIISAGGHPFHGADFIQAFERLLHAGLLVHDVGDNYFLSEKGWRISKEVKCIG